MIESIRNDSLVGFAMPSQRTYVVDPDTYRRIMDRYGKVGKCEECGGELVPSWGPIDYQVRGETVSVEGIGHAVCVSCGNEILDFDAIEELEARGIAMIKKSREEL